MTIDLNQFATLQKQSKASFNDQKRIVKQVMAGKTVYCVQCQQPLTLYTPEQSENSGIRCDKGCTDVALDFC
ncbi:hypothetical protein [Litorilituus lipolyticus]|uniref:Uncharacterized protein n=1 Tax=Litorilituus lipolyticus TaxID=2491017 RepID=A0A502KY71_9GAMM|nr:hypothetical protein [Litorilituus lipolyticus]TPH16730.1 hypothetical protein EPA86_06020 [Litorilituus lipolyticus]